MKKFYSLIENIFMGPMIKLAEQRHLRAVRDGMVSTIPLTIVGSFFLIIAFPPVPQSWKENISIFTWIQSNIGDILIPFRITMGLVAVYATYNIGYSLSRWYKLDGVSGGTLSLLAYFMTILPLTAVSSTGENLGFVLPMAKLGGAGLFVGIVMALFAVEILNFFKRKNLIIKMPEGVPESVVRSFEALFPTIAVVFITWIIFVVFKFDIHNIFNNIFNPLKGIVDTPIGAVVLVILITMLWTAGIHGVSIIGAIARPIWLEMLAANAEAMQNGSEVLPYITPEPFFQWFVWIGGSGGTLSLVCLLLFSKSKYLKDMGKATIIPSIFNINEPVIFGLPIMLNPFFTIPFILGPVLATIVSYIVMSLNLVSRPAILAPWTFPAPIGAYLTTGGDVRAVLLCIFNIILMGAIYYPFLRAYDKKMSIKELEDDILDEESSI
ncbi:PTS sugar transporter subunit IIC [Cetobacterium sp.]|uniref:PTS sugar transporter subunit IIC n=1 Tax=Cetobacterium sp. TaxID=2071632 RepID=UPI003EE5B48D